MSSIRRQLTIGVMVAVVLLQGLAAVVCYGVTARMLKRDFDAALADRARALCALVTQEPDGRLEVMQAETTMPEFGHGPDAQYLEIWDAGGNVVLRSASMRAADIAVPQSARDVAHWDAALPNGRPGRGVRVWFTPPVEVEPGAPPAPDPALAAGAAPGPRRERFALALLRDRSPVVGVARVLLVSLAVTFVLLGGATLAVVPAVVRRGLAPLSRLSGHAERIDVGSLSTRFPVDGLPRELRPIAGRLNDLLGRLEEGFRRERRFSADVAHELRTPIAELRTLAEVALRWPGDGASARAGFSDALAIARQMEAVVTTLLALARFDAGTLHANRETVDLAAVVRDAWRPLSAAASARDLAVTFALPDDAWARADPNMAAAIAGNLLSNAVAYCPAGKLVDCTVRRDGASVELCVSNAGDGLTPAHVEKVLEPFWRRDASRTDSSHSGLGLTLVAAYAKVLGAALDVRLTPDNRFRVSVRFAAADEVASAPGGFDPGLDHARVATGAKPPRQRVG